MRGLDLFLISTNAKKYLRSLNLMILLLLLATHFVFSVHAISQVKKGESIGRKEIIGIWQLNNNVVGSGLNKNFRFYGNGRFIFTFGGSDYDGRLLNVVGKYKIDSGLLFLFVEYRTEVMGGVVMPGLDGVIGAEFVIVDGETKVIKQSRPTEDYPFRLSLCEGKSSKMPQCIKIEYKKYYKLSSNPDAYK